MDKESLFEKLKKTIKGIGVKLGEDYKSLIPQTSSQTPLKERLFQSLDASTRLPRMALGGFVEGATGGLAKPLPQSPSNIFEKAPYEVGRLAGFLGTGKFISGLAPVKAITNPIIKTGVNLAQKEGARKIIGKGIVGVGEGVAYSVLPALSSLVQNGIGEAAKEVGRSTAFDLALSSIPAVGALAVSPLTRKKIESMDELASAVFKEFKGKKGKEVGVEIKDLFKKLTNKGYSISKDLLEKIEKTEPQKFIPFKEGLTYKEGERIFFGFDEGFKPKKLKMADKEELPLPPSEGKVKLTPKPVKQQAKIKTKIKPVVLPEAKQLSEQAIKIAKKTEIKPKEKPAAAYEKGKVSLASHKLIETKEDLGAIDSLFAQPRRVVENIGKEAKDFTVDFLAKSLAEGHNLQKEMVGKIKPILDAAGVKPDNQNDKLLFDFIENKIDKTALAQKIPDKVDAFAQAKTEIRKLYDDLLERINQVRKKFGKKPVEKRENYITHLIEMGDTAEILLGKNFGKRFFDTESRSSIPFFRFGVERKGAKNYSKSVLKALDAYTKAAAGQIYLPEAMERFNLLSKAAKKKKLEGYSHYLKDIASYLQKGMSKAQMVEKNEPVMRVVRNLIEEASNRVSKNLVSHNISASLSNLTQIMTTLPTQVSPQAYFSGWLKTITAPLTEDKNYMVDGMQSVFMRLRNTPPKLYEKKIEKILDKTNTFAIMSQFADNIAFRSFYEDALLKGMDFKEAIKYADDMAAKLVGERAIGLTPAFIRNANLFMKPLTMFTLEPINAFYSIFRDSFKMSEGSAINWAVRLGTYIVLAELFNQAMEMTIGRRFAFSPIDIAVKSADVILNKPYSDHEKAVEIAGIVSRNIPLADVFLGKGRYAAPIFAPVPTKAELEESPALAVAKAGLVGINPYGGGYQIYKTLEGLKAFNEGAVKTPKGEIKYPVEQDAGNLLKLALFGKSSTPEAREYYEEKRKPLTLKQSIMLEKTQDKKPAYQALMFQRAIDGEIQSMKNDITEKAYQGKLTPEFVEKRKERAVKAINYYAKKYKTPEGTLREVLKEVEKTGGETPVLDFAQLPQTFSKPTLVSGAKQKTFKGGIKIKPLKVKLPKIKLAKRKRVGVSFAKISPPPKIKRFNFLA